MPAVFKIKNLQLVDGLQYNIQDAGFGFTTNALTFAYQSGANGSGTSFEVTAINNNKSFEYNTDLICDYANLAINAVAYGLPGNTSANASATIENSLTFANNEFGSIFEIDYVSGNNYDSPISTFVRDVILGEDPLQGSVSYDTTSNTVTGTGSIFEYIFANDDIIALQANSSNIDTLEYVVIKEVVSNTEITLYGPPSQNSTVSAVYKAAPTLLPAQFPSYYSEFNSYDQIIGENENIQAVLFNGVAYANAFSILNSGVGFTDNETITAYVYNQIESVTISNPGANYSNGEKFYVVGGDPGVFAYGNLTTNNSGSITSLNLIEKGSGYNDPQFVLIKTANGSGGVIDFVMSEFNTEKSITGKVVKKSIGVSKGYWAGTDSFLNSNKKIQDSYYYQDYSYELKVNKKLSEYRDIIYNTFHSTGTELFGRFYRKIDESSNVTFADETINTYSTNTELIYMLASTDEITADSNTITVDDYCV